MPHKLRKLLVLPLQLLLLLSLACQHQVVHPGAINPIDSQTADALVIAQADLDQAKMNIQDGTWPKGWAGFVDEAGAAYNVAKASYLTWRDVVTGVKQGDANALQAQYQADLNNLAQKITSLFGRAGQKPPKEVK
jgi:hypothetical protein